MKDPNDTRDKSPRPGSPPWIHMTVVVAAGLAVFAWAMTRQSGLGSLTPHAASTAWQALVWYATGHMPQIRAVMSGGSV